VHRAAYVAPYRLSAIRAKLFYEQSGTFSEDILASSGFALWNVVIGEGDAREPSSSTLVLIEVSGKPGAYQPSQKVEVVATRVHKGRKGKSDVTRRLFTTGILGKDGRWVAPLWLYDTGTEPIVLKARILGPKPSAWVTRKIPFASGE
jgi:hypothetical protein